MSEYRDYIVRISADGSTPREKLTEIVRCRDCKWMSKDTVHYKACYRLHAIEFMVEPDGFCAWGERRERKSAEVWNQWSANDVTCSEES